MDSTTCRLLRPRSRVGRSLGFLSTPVTTTTTQRAVHDATSPRTPDRKRRRRQQHQQQQSSSPLRALVTPDHAGSSSFSTRAASPVGPNEESSSLSSLRAISFQSENSRLDRRRAEKSVLFDLGVSPAELRPSATLTTGQCFHWEAQAQEEEEGDDEKEETEEDVRKNGKQGKKASAWGTHNAKEWIGLVRQTLVVSQKSTGQKTETETLSSQVLSKNTGEQAETVTSSSCELNAAADSTTIILKIQETESSTLCEVLYHGDGERQVSLPDTSYKAVLAEYFQLGEPLVPLYRRWASACPRMKQISQALPGVRIIQQDPWECLISFICSSNNNIPRITKILKQLRRQYGTYLTTYQNEDLYSFPSPHQLSQATEADLKAECGLGYRAKYIVKTTRQILELGGESYLHRLRLQSDAPYVQEQLLQFAGVGRKVADCVALFSLQQPEAIPIDVHVWNIAVRDYDRDQHLSTQVKSLTPTVYRQVQNLFVGRFAPFSGWASSLLFVAELPSFRSALPEAILREMDEFRLEEQARKKSKSKKTDKSSQ